MALASASVIAAQGVPKLERVAAIGCADCGGALQFSEVASVAVTPQGVVWVADRDDPRIRAFSIDGKPLRSFGRKGRGPGEFAGIEQIFPASDGSISVVDMLAYRVVRVDSLGRHLGSTTLGAFPFDASAAPGSTTIDVLISRFRPGTSSVLRVAPGADSGKTVAGPFTDFPRADAAGEPHSFAVAADGRIAIADGNEEYRIRIISPSGAPRDITRNVPRKLRTPEEMGALKAQTMRGGEQRSAESRAAGGTGAGRSGDAPTLKAHLTWLGLRFDPSGRLWVRTQRGDDTRTIFDLFDRTLAFVGEVSIPGNVTQFGLGDAYLVTASLNADGVPQVTVWRIR